MKVIVYFFGDNKIIVGPTSDLPIEAVAQKDVPHTIPYWFYDSRFDENGNIIVDEITDMSKPDGYGGNFGNGTEFPVVTWTDTDRPIVTDKKDNYFAVDQSGQFIPVEILKGDDGTGEYKVSVPEKKIDDSVINVDQSVS